MTRGLQPLGNVVRLQIQQGPLKEGERGHRVYNTAPLLPLPVITVHPEGVTAVVGDETVLDVHHASHPAGKNLGNNGISVLFTSHYQVMQRQFGEHVAYGVAGESILIETNRMITSDDLDGGLVLGTSDGQEIHLTDLVEAEPCVEFTRFCLASPSSGKDVSAALVQLRGGMRGFYASYGGEPLSVHVGDRVFLPSYEES